MRPSLKQRAALRLVERVQKPTIRSLVRDRAAQLALVKPPKLNQADTYAIIRRIRRLYRSGIIAEAARILDNLNNQPSDSKKQT